MGRGMHNVAKVHLGFHVGIFRDENMEAIWAFGSMESRVLRSRSASRSEKVGAESKHKARNLAG